MTGRLWCGAALVLLIALGGDEMTSPLGGTEPGKDDGAAPDKKVPNEKAPDLAVARYSVRMERNQLIPMRDGKKLAADILRPDGDGRFPVILEYIPYRKDDVSRGSLDALYYFAERGFIAVRLDVRGTGGSEGVNTDEYVPQEQEDGIDAVEWLGTQPWSNGNVGMFGTSYGGFTCVQVAMHRPPHLKAIVPMYATDDRYTDDCHYTPGGNMRMYYDVGTYGGSMVAMNALPPAQDLAGSEWAALWKDRLEKNEPYLLKWMKYENQVDGPYWRTASLRPNYDRVACPTFLIGGWNDGYATAMLRMYEKLKCPRKLLMGPWVHSRPNVSTPGPRINYLHEVVRFFAETLAGQPTGSLSEAPVAVYMQEFATPLRTTADVPGRWRNDNQYVFLYREPGSSLRLDLLKDNRLSSFEPRAGNPPSAFEEFEYVPTVGVTNRFWSAGGISYYLPEDQRADEAYSRTFTTEPFPDRVNLGRSRNVNILGEPVVVLYASSTASVATFVAKLSDVAPDGTSALITDGSLNITRRKSLTAPEPQGAVNKLEIRLAPTGWVLRPGHRLRLSISGSDFPNLWPTPEKGTHRVYFGKNPSHVELPIVAESQLDPPQFLPPPKLQEIVKTYGTPPEQTVTYDQINGTVTMSNRTAGTTVLDEQRGTLLSEHGFRCTASSRDPAQASIVGTHKYVLTRDGDVIDVTAESSVRATATTFHILINLNVTKNGQPFFQKSWTASERRRML